ncbi:MAG: outer membrane protein assembly factor BamA [candidate division Zixibacteria bacterium]|nr:outer membrane protein assembly factor BamA [candidate division Zixibacteria bacterium]
MTSAYRQRARIALFCCIILLAGVLSGLAQQQYRIVDVAVEGNHVATRSLILGVSSLDTGNSLTSTDVAKTIRRLYGLGIFSDVRIDAEPVTGGVKIYIIVKELPKLTGLEFSGNDEISTKDLREQLGLGVGGYISPYLVQEKKNEILEANAKEGYFQASVTPSLNYNSDSSEAVLSYLIDEKSKVKVEKVVITGNKKIEDDDLIDNMRNRKRGFLRSSDFAQDKYDEDLEKVIAEYHKKGFIDAYLISDSIYIDTTRNRMTIYLDVYEGPKYYFGEVTFSGNEELSDKMLHSIMKFKSGEVFDKEKYDVSWEELGSAYYEIGHLHVQIIDERQTQEDSIINVNYEISEGLPSHINLVNIVGNYKTKEKVIRRELSTRPGQKFNRTRLIRSIRDVMALNFFTKVEPTPINLPNGDVNIEFNVEEKQTGQISAGAGYNSMDKLVGTFGMGIPNFRGNGQNLSFNVDFGSRRNSFSVSFTEPWLFDRPTLLGISAFSTNRRWYDDYTEGRRGGSIRLGRRLNWPDNYFRIYTSYALERNRFYDFDDNYLDQNSYKSSHYYDNPATTDTRYDEPLAQTIYGPYPGSVISYGENAHTASRFSFTVVRDSRNLPEFATKGSILSYHFENTGGIMGGFWKYQKHKLSLSKFIPLFWNMAIAAKVEYGFVTSPDGDNRILISDRFTPGGTSYDGIVRGYDDGSLTPDSTVTQSDTSFFYNDPNAVAGVDPAQDTTFSSYQTRVRGKYMLITNLELQIPISENQIYGLLFFDAGNSWLNRNDIKPLSGLYRGVGFGFRVVVPSIGTIGFDFGYSLDNVYGQEKGWNPHFQMGTTFR